MTMPSGRERDTRPSGRERDTRPSGRERGIGPVSLRAEAVTGRHYDAELLTTLLEKHRHWLERGGPIEAESGGRLRLVAAVLDGMKLDNAQLSQTVIEASWVRSASLRGLRAQGASFSGTDFTASDLSGGLLDGANLRGARFHRAILKNTRFLKADLSVADSFGPSELTECEVVSANFSEALLSNASFLGCRLSDVTFDNADLSNARFDFCDIGKLSVRQAHLHRTDFRRASFSIRDDELLSHLQRQGASLPRRPSEVEMNIALAGHAEWLRSEGRQGARASFREQSLARESAFSNADLCGADFRGANLAGADFSGARLICADFRGAFLNEADFSSSDIRGAWFDGAFQFSLRHDGARDRLARGFEPRQPAMRQNVGIERIPLAMPPAGFRAQSGSS